MLSSMLKGSDSMFLFIDFVRVTNCYYDYDYEALCIYSTARSLDSSMEAW